jgi:pimeloyl-ACP methyl ester carboxylesterase
MYYGAAHGSLCRPHTAHVQASEPTEQKPERMHFQREGMELSVLDFGGSGSPVLLLHGLAGYAGEWSDTAAWLVRNHRVLGLDERGHGHSTRIPADVSRDAHVADVAYVIEHLGLGQVVLVGQSLGGSLAFVTAARHPELVRGLVVAEACPDADPDGEGVAGIRRWLDRWPLPFASREDAVEFFGGPSLYASSWSGGLEQREDGWWPRFDADVMLRTLSEGTSVSYWEEWQRVRCSTLLVRAGNGFFPTDYLQAMAARLPGARFVDIPDAKHDVHLDRPEQWRAALSEFLAALAPANVTGTLSTYEQGIDAYIRDSVRTPGHEDFLRRVLELLPHGAHMLELGTGPGHDALFFESGGVNVRRTDGAIGFVARLRAGGLQAGVLEITSGDFGGPYDVVFANAVLVHLTDAQLDLVLAKAFLAVRPGGLLAFTVKEGDGDAWSTAKVGRPRFFNYWREPSLLEHVLAAGWRPLSVKHVQGRTEPWINVICSSPGVSSASTT